MLEQQLVNGLMLGSVYALVAVAFTLAIGVLNFLNFSIPALFMVAGMLTWFCFKTGLPWPLAALLAVASGGLLSILVERFTYRLMSRSEHFVPLVTSMAFLNAPSKANTPRTSKTRPTPALPDGVKLDPPATHRIMPIKNSATE